MELNPDFWRRCSSCKTPIKYSAAYYVCSVSTCNRKRIGYVFCSVHCWERHLPGARHKDAAAVEARSPSLEQWRAELGDDAVAPGAAPVTSGSAAALSATGARAPLSPEQQAAAVAAARGSSTSPESSSAAASSDRTPQRVIVKSAGGSSPISPGAPARPIYKDSLEAEILVVVSKMKNYVRERAEMNTSDSVMNLLSDRLRRLCDRAIEKARADGRKTIMDRDFN
jgi:histone H3/H4